MAISIERAKALRPVNSESKANHRIARDKARIKREVVASGKLKSIEQATASKVAREIKRKQKRAQERAYARESMILVNHMPSIEQAAKRKQKIITHAYESRDYKLVKSRASFSLKEGGLNLGEWFKPE